MTQLEWKKYKNIPAKPHAATVPLCFIIVIIFVKITPPTVSTAPANISLANGFGSFSNCDLGTMELAPNSVNNGPPASGLPVMAATL